MREGGIILVPLSALATTTTLLKLPHLTSANEQRCLVHLNLLVQHIDTPDPAV